MARAVIPTASEFDNLLTPTFEVKRGKGPATYLAKKIAEAWQGGPIMSQSGFSMEQGQILEPEAVPWFELERNVEVQRVGLVTTDDGLYGCSPDGLIGEHSGIEIKCPAAHTHARYLLAGTLPEDYSAQVHGCMFITQRPQWTFLSYRRGFPNLVLDVPLDEQIQSAIGEALALFQEKFDTAWARMLEINGGPPRHKMTPDELRKQMQRVELVAEDRSRGVFTTDPNDFTP